MGKGTTAMNTLPKKRKLYGDNEFHLRPIYQGKDALGREQYYFALRPKTFADGDYLFELEGEFGSGESSLEFEKRYVRRGDYKHTRYVYYKEDLEDMTEQQKKKIMKWAIDGEL